MGTLPGDASSNGVLTIPSTGVNTFKVRYPRAKNRPDVSGSLRWPSDLTNWHTSGQSNGTHSVTFAEAVVSAEAADPETVEATADFEAAFERAWSAKTAALIEVRVDPDAISPRTTLSAVTAEAKKAKKG